MCGRYRRRSDKQRIAETFRIHIGLDDVAYDEGDDLSPQSLQPVIFTNNAGERKVGVMRWAFKLPDRVRPLFNARSEGIEQASFWKDAFLGGRCIVPADAVYEWQTVANKKKVKYEFIVSGQQPFAMAAVWKLWKNQKTDLWEPTFAILTGEPNELMAPIHDRMTTFIEPRDYDEYLAPAERPPIHLLRILPATKMKAKPVNLPTSLDKQAGLFDNL